MKIKSGGAISNLRSRPNIETIRISKDEGRSFGLWINEESLSYLTVEELLGLKDEIDKSLLDLLKPKSL